MFENCGYKMILKVTIPEETYSEEEIKKIYKIIKEQVGDILLPVSVPEGVKFEIVE